MKHYDVIVSGGGPSGVAAAIAAARNGSRVLLIEREAYFGGMATAAGIPTFGPFTNGVDDLIGGIGREILEELKKESYNSPFYDNTSYHVKGLDWYPIDVEILKRILDRMVTESGCDVLFHTSVIGVETADGKVNSITIYNKSGIQQKTADYFIDCTGDADIAAMAGAGIEYGDENGQVQSATLCFKVANVNTNEFMEYAKAVNETGNLLRAVERAKAAGRFPKGEAKVCGIAFTNEGVASLNFGHVYQIQPLNVENLTKAEMKARARLPELLDFLREFVPGMGQAVLVESGPCLGIRESRRIKGLYTMTKEDYLNRADFPDAIAYYSYPIDIHPAEPDLLENDVNFELYHSSHYSKGECYGIPYRSLIPQGFVNLLVAGRTISADREMMSSVRIMSPCFATGQAAGTAAALCHEQGNVDTAALDADILRGRIEQQR